MSWLWAIGVLNCLRVCVYGNDTSSAACMRPRGPAESTRRSRSRPSMSTRTPRFRGPSMCEEGTKTESKTISPVLDPRMPSLSSFLVTEKPGDEVGTMKAEMPLLPAVGVVLA
jgi:hypothetical protein